MIPSYPLRTNCNLGHSARPLRGVEAVIKCRDHCRPTNDQTARPAFQRIRSACEHVAARFTQALVTDGSDQNDNWHADGDDDRLGEVHRFMGHQAPRHSLAQPDNNPATQRPSVAMP